MKRKNGLIGPLEYWNIATLNKPSFINGCGGTGLTEQIVPNYLLGLNISQACAIHDYMYEQRKDKKHADDIFLENMISIVDQKSNSIILKGLRKIKAYVYYYAVKLFGSFYFKASTTQ